MALDYQDSDDDDDDNSNAFTKNNNNSVVGGNFSSSSYRYGSEDSGNVGNCHRSINRRKLEEILPPSTTIKNNNISFEQGLDYILSHFEEPIWPRTIFTKTLGRQYTVYNKKEALARFKQSNLLDCRINAYPYYVGFDGINRQPPNFIFIDIDHCFFKTGKEFWLAVEKTCRNMNDILGDGTKPTTIWTGNGVHIYQPVEAVVLEQESLFANFDQPSQTFLKFAAQYLSNHKSDTNNNPAFRSCLLRIPGSHNVKCVEQNNGIADSSTEIKIIQRWDRVRPRINPFYIYLADAKIKEINSVRQLQRKKERYRITTNNVGGVIQNSNTIQWIEKLLHTPIDDYRKNAISLILAPYLINIKKLSYDDAFNIINSWLDKCRQLRRLDSNLGSITKYMLKESIRNGHKPLKFETLMLKNKILYEMLRQQNY